MITSCNVTSKNVTLHGDKISFCMAQKIHPNNNNFNNNNIITNRKKSTAAVSVNFKKLKEKIKDKALEHEIIKSFR